MSITESEKKLKMEEAAFHELRENLAIYADQLQDEAAENHCGVGAYLHLSSDSTEFFMLHSVEDGRLTGAYHFGSVPIFRVDRHTPAELSAALVDFVKGFYELRRSITGESIFDDETYEQVGHELMMGFMKAVIDDE